MASVRASALPIDHPGRVFTKSEPLLPVPFATTTTMLEAFVQERASLTLDRSCSYSNFMRLCIGKTGRKIMYSTMRIALLAATVCAAGGMLTSKAEATPISKAAFESITQHPPLLLVQGCPRGYNFSYRTGRCYPAYLENYRDSYREGYYREYGGYGRCPRGYNRNYNTGRCYPAYLENR
jgi:hypothetical protein